MPPELRSNSPQGSLSEAVRCGSGSSSIDALLDQAEFLFHL